MANATELVRGGSPLRGQGTRAGTRWSRSHKRFTPARAGNTLRLTGRVSDLLVHPCAGREHATVFSVVFVGIGSPLRGQGTPAYRGLGFPALRFTPARAGNTRLRLSRRLLIAVHPCAGREHGDAQVLTVELSGSPLRGQGTLVRRWQHASVERFTPARAGNTRCRSAGIASGSVHPCAGREHRDGEVVRQMHGGSPLRGQGTRICVFSRRLGIRFTPARAGNTEVLTRRVGGLSVHPCAGREHRVLRIFRLCLVGSPLRGQGTRLRNRKPGLAQRFTPARAGNTG